MIYLNTLWDRAVVVFPNLPVHEYDVLPGTSTGVQMPIAMCAPVVLPKPFRIARADESTQSASQRNREDPASFSGDWSF